MASKSASLLGQLERLRTVFGSGAAARKRALLEALGKRRLASARQVERFHELLCFQRAYPDDRAVLARVESLLAGFARRPDLRRHRRALADTGIAGTETRFTFYWFTAAWLARNWPGQVRVDWGAFEDEERLQSALLLLLPYSETPARDETKLGAREWVERLKREGETDAAFLLRRFEALAVNSFLRERYYEDLHIPLRLAPGPDPAVGGAGTPARTLAHYTVAPIFLQQRPLRRTPALFKRAVAAARLRLRPVAQAEAEQLIHRARESMVTRQRDLDVFECADPRDVRLADCGEGLQFACIGARPERRLLLESVYAFLTLKNGVPIGYVLLSGLFGSSEVAYNVFESFRGAESAHVYAHVLALARRLFGSDSFTIDPYQLGHENDEGLRSGAWWFYYRLGFRSRDPEVKRVLAGELAQMRRNPRHRSDLATLRKLAAKNVFLHLGRPRVHRERAEVLGRVSLEAIGFSVSRVLAERFGADRERAEQVCAREAQRVVGLRSLDRFTADQRLWWRRWAPLVVALSEVERWSAAEKRALVGVVRAKAGRYESDFARLFDGHRRLRRAVLRLAAED